jgi:hypothetical protein
LEAALDEGLFKLIGRWVFLAALVGAAGVVLKWILMARFPARIPPDLRYEHELSSSKKLRDVAIELGQRFVPFNRELVVCMGPVRGNAARLLFHSGPKNKGRGNIHRRDHVLSLKRLGPHRIGLELTLNSSYSYMRANRKELTLLSEALHEAFDGIATI